MLVLVVLLVAFLFYGLIPGLGAFAVRGHWRAFRNRLLRSSFCPFVQYSDLKGPDRFLGHYRFFGQLEAMQGETRVWITSGSFTVEADLAGVSVYLLPTRSSAPDRPGSGRVVETLPEEEPRSVLWQRIYSLPAGTRMFVGGPLELENGRALFRSRPREPLVVVIYDGEEDTILPRVVWGARQRNEYWNRYTLASLITGSFSLFLLAFFLLRSPLLRLPALVALALSSAPLAILLPPGVILYFLYIRFWKRARLLRARRDLLVLPLRYFRGTDGRSAERSAAAGVPSAAQADGGFHTVRLPMGEPYAMTRDCGVPIAGEPGVRGADLESIPESRRGGTTLFGALREENGRTVLAPPEDPMAELVLILGDPAFLSRECSRRARRFEWLSALLAAAGLALNLFLVLYAISFLIR